MHVTYEWTCRSLFRRRTCICKIRKLILTSVLHRKGFNLGIYFSISSEISFQNFHTNEAVLALAHTKIYIVFIYVMSIRNDYTCITLILIRNDFKSHGSSAKFFFFLEKIGLFFIDSFINFHSARSSKLELIEFVTKIVFIYIVLILISFLEFESRIRAGRDAVRIFFFFSTSIHS